MNLGPCFLSRPVVNSCWSLCLKHLLRVAQRLPPSGRLSHSSRHLSQAVQSAVLNCHRQDGLNYRKLLLMDLGAGKSKIKFPEWSQSEEGPLPVHRRDLLILPSPGRRHELYGIFFFYQCLIIIQNSRVHYGTFIYAHNIIYSISFPSTSAFSSLLPPPDSLPQLYQFPSIFLIGTL